MNYKEQSKESSQSGQACVCKIPGIVFERKRGLIFYAMREILLGLCGI